MDSKTTTLLVAAAGVAVVGVGLWWLSSPDVVPAAVGHSDSEEEEHEKAIEESDETEMVESGDGSNEAVAPPAPEPESRVVAALASRDASATQRAPTVPNTPDPAADVEANMPIAEVRTLLHSSLTEDIARGLSIMMAQSAHSKALRYHLAPPPPPPLPPPRSLQSSFMPPIESLGWFKERATCL
jgi:hypothetical protein